ncbi:hypothetical protein RUM43_007567 [Polyplax serrata]|uniref:TRAF3-interacting protein 1 C-terminal domain-containing protein n=1 Tax=Polyplax serrata TaxID=468196 RepID=A0AAN8P5W8_POLSC
MTESKNSKSVISKTKSTRNHSKEVKQEQSDKKETPKAIFENGVHEKNGVAENKNTNENVKNRITRNSQQTKKKKESNTKQEDKKGIEKKTKEKPLVYENEHEEMNVKHKEHDASKDKVSFIEGGDSAALSKIDDIKVNGMKDQSDQNVMESQLLQEIPTRKPTGKHKHREPSVFSSTSERKLNANSEIENLEAQNKDNESKPEKINFCNKYEEGPQEQDQTPSLSGQPNYIKKDPNIVREKTGLMSRPRTGIRPTTARPASARPAAPRIKERGDVISAEESTMPTPIKINVIVDRDLHNETEDDNLISLETENDILLDEISTAPLPVVSQPNGHGHLVEQILEVKRELEDDRRLPSSEEKNNEKGNIEWESRRNAETEIREIEKLRSLIQLLTRSTNPLGKLLDFFQEDVDSMQRELEVWKNKNSSLCIQIAHEKSITEQFVEPLKIHLKEIQQSIDEQSDQISHVKANIIKNNQKIRKLLFGV